MRALEQCRPGPGTACEKCQAGAGAPVSSMKRIFTSEITSAARDGSEIKESDLDQGVFKERSLTKALRVRSKNRTCDLSMISADWPIDGGRE
jgi:hypothetical protein